MIDPEDRRAQLSPQLAMRVAVLGGIAFVIFAVIFFRLWFLQVLSGDQYLTDASNNRVRTVVIQAPRGEMTDRNGNVLVTNRRAVEVLVSPPRLPAGEAKREQLFRRLSWVLGRSRKLKSCRFGPDDRATFKQLMPLECKIEQAIGALPYADVVVDSDASPAEYTYLSERAERFPGVSTQNAWLREYQYREVGGQLFGTVGQINAEQLSDPAFRGIRGGSIVGKTGLEAVYDHYLRGMDGEQRVQVNARGLPTGRRLRETLPTPGNQLKLSIDLGLERVGQQALRTGEGLAATNGNAATGGAFVAMDPRNGEILGMGSDPSFDPNLFAGPIVPASIYNRLFRDPRTPLVNRAVAGQYAVGSTFKVVTAAAALANGWSAGRMYDDVGTWRSGDQTRRNAGGAVYGPVNLVTAISYSVDTFFYNLGDFLNVAPEGHPHGGQLQAWARKLGLGSLTGIDLAPEGSGAVPDPHAITVLQNAQRACLRRRHGEPCQIADLTDTWTVGDNASFAIGQGDFLATPLQMAVVYAAIENNGAILTPHIGLDVVNDRQEVIQPIEPRPARHITIPGLDAIQAGLLGATTDDRGTSTDVFRGFGKPVYGKTGTAQYEYRPDTSWYVAYVPDPVRPIVVACVIENGGFGAEAAAPAVRQILSQWFYGHPGRVVAGSSTTA
ncbi:MAG TPA: penicillin-binding protein 2 [Conexibacter sp.]